MRKSTSALLAAAACVLLGGCITAERHQQLMAEHADRMETGLANGKGVVLIDGAFEERGCNDVVVELTRVRNAGQAPDTTQRTGSFRISSLSGPEPLVVQPGDWVVSSMTCEIARYRQRIAGPHAAFRVQPGEAVNVGKLRLHSHFDNLFIQTGGTVQRKVEPVSEQVIDKNRRLFPATMAKMVLRPMAILGPQETRFKRRGLLF